MNNLRSFLQLLDKENELVRISVPVSSNLELAEIHRRVIAAGGPALLFERVEGTDFPAVTNLFGTTRRVDLAFGKRPAKFLRELVEVAHELSTFSPGKFWGHRGLVREALKVGLHTQSRGPVLECRQEEPNLSRLPLIKTWPQDGGNFVTLPLVYTEHPDSGQHNLGMYRIQQHHPRLLGVHWQIQKGGGFHYHVAEQRNEALPLALFVGGPPALILSAIAPLPEGLPELVLTSLLQGSKLRRVRDPNGPLPLLAEAEFAIVGRVPPHRREPEGPFGDHYGYYSLCHDYPVLEVDNVYHRKGAIFPATVVGKPPQEDFYLGNYIQELMAPLSKLVMPAIKAIWSYGETGYHCLSTIVVEERYPREAMKFAFRILGEDGGQLALTKFLIVHDGSGVDLKDFRQVLAYVLARTDLETDLFVIANLAMDTLDYSGPAVNEGSKGILLGVGDRKRTLQAEFVGPLPAGASDAQVYCPGCLAVAGPGYASDPGYAERLARDSAMAPWPLLVLVDDASIVNSNVRFLWTTFTRFEPAADVWASDVQLKRHHPCFSPPVVFDCRLKPGFPEELVSDEDVVARVTSRWHEYFPDKSVAGEEDPLDYRGFARIQ